VFSLNLDLGLPRPPFFGRKPVRHTIFDKYSGSALDDHLDDLYLQASTQWDGLRHFGDPEHGFYNGAQLADLVQEGSRRLGIQRWAERGIAARAVLLDLTQGLSGADPLGFFPIGAALLEAAAARQGVDLRTGDVLLLRTGWLEAYERLDESRRE